DVAAVAEHVSSEAGGGADAVFTLGFCFGGRNSFNQAAGGHGLAGVIGLYGFVGRRDEHDAYAPVDLAARYEAPVLGLFGGADRHITPDHIAQFGAALDAAGVANELVTYDGAPHSFFDRTAAEHAEASEDAWRRMLGFIRANRGSNGTGSPRCSEPTASPDCSPDGGGNPTDAIPVRFFVQAADGVGGGRAARPLEADGCPRDTRCERPHPDAALP